MKFKIDENLPIEAADLLAAHGHDAATVLQESLGGADDMSIIRVCQREERALVTLDLDFADIRAYPPAEYFGIVVLRLRIQTIENVLTVLGKVNELLRTESLVHRLWIVDKERVRIRS